MKRDPNRTEQLRRAASDWLALMQGPVSDADRTAFQRWHDADPAHAEAYARVKARYESAGLLARSDLPRSRLRREPAATGRRSYALAAGLAALFLLSGLVLFNSPITRPAAEGQFLVFATEIGEIRELALEDGSRMTLDTKSAVEVALRPDLRHVTLREGRARFNVSAADERPFVVEAARSRSTSRDATFDVVLSGSDATVTPVAGTVSVQSLVERGERPTALAAPGEAVQISAGGELREYRLSNPVASRWPSGMLDFDNATLDRVVAEANRYSRTQIRLANSSLAGLRVTGVYRAGDVTGLARSLEAALGLRLERTEGGHFLLSGSGAAAPLQ